jgi:hypothetical protein
MNANGAEAASVQLGAASDTIATTLLSAECIKLRNALVTEGGRFYFCLTHAVIKASRWIDRSTSSISVLRAHFANLLAAQGYLSLALILLSIYLFIYLLGPLLMHWLFA